MHCTQPGMRFVYVCVVFCNAYCLTIIMRLQTSYGLGGQVLNWSLHICVAVFNTYAHRRPVIHRQRFCTEYRRNRSSHRSYSFCTPLTCCSWWSATNYFLMSIRGRHSDLRVLPTRRFCRPLRESVRLCQWGFGLDGIQSPLQLNHAKTEILGAHL